MPILIRAPARPPIGVPAFASLSKDMIGPAAISGPNPGLARTPMSASDPSAPLAKSSVPSLQRKENRNIRVPKTLALHFSHRGLHLFFGRENSQNDRVCHR